jgi:hypothetical protein
MRRVVDWTVHVVNDHRRTGKSAVHVAHQVTCARQKI